MQDEKKFEALQKESLSFTGGTIEAACKTNASGTEVVMISFQTTAGRASYWMDRAKWDELFGDAPVVEEPEPISYGEQYAGPDEVGERMELDFEE